MDITPSLFDGRTLYASKEVAKKFGITANGMNVWLREHEEFSKNPEYVLQISGGARPRRYFTELGVTVYGTIKEGFRGSQHKGEVTSPLMEAKEKIAQTAYHHVSPQMYNNDPIIQMRMEQLQMKQDVEYLLKKEQERAQRHEDASQELDRFSPPTLPLPEISKRQELRKIINRYAQENDIEHSMLWNKLYTEGYYRLRYNVSSRIQHTGKSKLDQVEEDGMMEQFYSLAYSLFT